MANDLLVLRLPLLASRYRRSPGRHLGFEMVIGVAAGGCERARDLAIFQSGMPGCFGELAKIGQPGFQAAFRSL